MANKSRNEFADFICVLIVLFIVWSPVFIMAAIIGSTMREMK